MKTCPKCGKEVGEQEGVRFCPFCGTGIEVTSRGTIYLGGGTPGTVDGEPVTDGKPDHFGRYRVIKEIGTGAMGVVYLARDDKIGRSVAIKTLSVRQGLSPDEVSEVKERFAREARAAGTLQHPNIVVIFDVGEEEGVPFIAMEHLQGTTLVDFIREGASPVPRATHIVTQLLTALSYAHGHNVVHRDIKPDNVFLLPDGTVKVVDFGIALVQTASTITVSGQVLGTPRYMSPEQVKGEAVGPPSDIFSTGTLLYEMLAGRPAYDGDTPTTVMYKIVHEQPRPLLELSPSVPHELDAVIAKATAKIPSERYSSASEMSVAMNRAASAGDAGAMAAVAPRPAAPPQGPAPEPQGGRHKFCGGCGIKLPPDGKFCPDCGTPCYDPLEAAPAAGRPARLLFCGQCGTGLPAASRTCSRCGFNN
ncbi:MAG: protein kinase [Actinobacteria bacterium]|nr:protein kinase [Actinomycetota bacterium]MBU1944121.1 protein kinase [Actinomycetota bacterium]MBU2686720.1 protein kinase [Actinomycetota bacterium]